MNAIEGHNSESGFHPHYPVFRHCYLYKSAHCFAKLSIGSTKNLQNNGEGDALENTKSRRYTERNKKCKNEIVWN